MARLSVQLNGQPVFLYWFSRGTYEERQRLLYAHPSLLTETQVVRLVTEAAKKLPQEIDYDYMANPRELDLFERAIAMAGFIEIDGDVLVGLNMPWMSSLVTERAALEEALART